MSESLPPLPSPLDPSSPSSVADFSDKNAPPLPPKSLKGRLEGKPQVREGTRPLYRWQASTLLQPATKVNPTPFTSLTVTLTSTDPYHEGEERVILDTGVQGNHGAWLLEAVEDLLSRVPPEVDFSDWGEADHGAFALLEEGWKDLWGREEWEAASPLARLLALLYTPSFLSFLPLPPVKQGESYPQLFMLTDLDAALPSVFTPAASPYQEAFLPGHLWKPLEDAWSQEGFLQEVVDLCAIDPVDGPLLEALYAFGAPEVYQAWQVVHAFYMRAHMVKWEEGGNLRRMKPLTIPHSASPQDPPPPLPGKFFATLPWLPGMLPPGAPPLEELLSTDKPQEFFNLGAWPARTSLEGESTSYDWFLWHKFHTPLSPESIRQVLEGWLQDFFYSTALFTPDALQAWASCGPLLYLLHRLLPWRDQFTAGEQALLLYRCAPFPLRRLLVREVANFLPQNDVARPFHDDDLVFLGMLTDQCSPHTAASVILSWPNCRPSWEYQPLRRQEVERLTTMALFTDSPQTWWLSFLREGEMRARLAAEKASSSEKEA